MANMRVWKNYKIWGVAFLFFLMVWIGRTSLITYRLSVERATSKYELEMKAEQPRVPTIPTKQPIDGWSWIIKIGSGLTGLKTLLEIIDKFKKKGRR